MCHCDSEDEEVLKNVDTIVRTLKKIDPIKSFAERTCSCSWLVCNEVFSTLSKLTRTLNSVHTLAVFFFLFFFFFSMMMRQEDLSTEQDLFTCCLDLWLVLALVVMPSTLSSMIQIVAASTSYFGHCCC